MTKDRFDKGKDIAHILSIVALPIIVAVLGWKVQEGFKTADLRKEYVGIAINVLSSGESDSQMKQWATAMLQEYSPVPWPEGAAEQIAKALRSSSTTDMDFEALLVNLSKEQKAGREEMGAAMSRLATASTELAKQAAALEAARTRENEGRILIDP